MKGKRRIYNLAAKTAQDRRFYRLVRKMTPEEITFATFILEYLNESPTRAENFTERAKGYKIGTAAGRAAFMAALQAERGRL